MNTIEQRAQVILKSLTTENKFVAEVQWTTIDERVCFSKNGHSKKWSWYYLDDTVYDADLHQYQTRTQAVEVAKMLTSNQEKKPDFSSLKMEPGSRSFTSPLLPVTLARSFIKKPYDWSLFANPHLYRPKGTWANWSKPEKQLYKYLGEKWMFDSLGIGTNKAYKTRRKALESFCWFAEQHGVDLNLLVDFEAHHEH